MVFVKQYYKSIIFSILIMVVCFLPKEDFQSFPTFNCADKVVHILLFLLVTALVCIEKKQKNRLFSKTSRWQYCFLYPVLLGAFIEIVQGLFIASRSGDIIDFLFDLAGILVVFVPVYFIREKRKSDG